jgi:phage FluMu protein Com
VYFTASGWQRDVRCIAELCDKILYPASLINYLKFKCTLIHLSHEAVQSMNKNENKTDLS